MSDYEVVVIDTRLAAKTRDGVRTYEHIFEDMESDVQVMSRTA